MLKICLYISTIVVVFGKQSPPCSQIDEFNDYNVVSIQELLKMTDGNLAVSIYTTGKLLSLIMLGARGDTARQIKEVLNLDGSDRDIKNWFKVMTSEMSTAKNITIDVAIKAYLAGCVAIEADFEKLADDYYDAGLQNINFYDSEQTAFEINNWVQEKTNNKINNIIRENSINALTRLIFINTLYFSGEFKYPFPISATRKADFCISKTESVKVDMMTISGNYLMSNHPDSGTSMIFIPFKNQRANLLILLPDDIERAEYVRDNVLTTWHNRNFTQSYVQIFLPKFKIDSTILMKPFLETMGITRLFSEPDLSGISRDDIVPSEIFQRIFIDVNEVGTNAGTGSSVPIEEVAFSLPDHKMKPCIFKVDRPFFFSLFYDGLGIIGGKMNKF